MSLTSIYAKSRRPFRLNPYFVAFLLILVALHVSTLRQSVPLVHDEDRALEDVAAYLRQNLPPTAVLETSDSSLFLFYSTALSLSLDEISVPLIHHIDQSETVSIDYDALAAHPGGIVVGPFSQAWQLYDKAPASRQFQRAFSNSRYEVYQPRS